MARDITKGIADKSIANLIKQPDNVKAQEILLRIAEVYNPTQRILALSGKLPGNEYENVTSSQQIVSRFTQKLCELGYDLTRIIDEVSKAYTDLKDSGQI